MSEQPFTAFRLYDKNGLQFTLSFPIPCLSALDFDDQAAQSVNRVIEIALRNGFTIQAPERAEGDKIEISAVVRGQGTNRDGELTDRIWMYAPWGDEDKGSQLTVYMNNSDDVTAFEVASGLKINDLPVCKGKAAPTRESGDFERYHQATSFSIIRTKVDAEGSVTGYRWKLVQYVDSVRRIDINPTPPPSTTPPKKNAKSDSKPLTPAPTATGAGSTEHWGLSEANRAQVAKAFAEYGVKGKAKMIEAIEHIEKAKFGNDAVAQKLTDTRIESVNEYLSVMRQLYEEW